MSPLTRREMLLALLVFALATVRELFAFWIRNNMARLVFGLTARLQNPAGTYLLVPGPTIPSASTFQACADGGWCWFADPRAVYYNGVTYFGYVDNAGNIQIRTFTHATSVVSAATTLHATMEVDDHDNPTILIRASDSRILVFYSKHIGSTIYLRVSTNPEDISAWDAEQDLDASLGGISYTYPSPLYTSANSRIYLFYRHHDASNVATWRYNVSTDGTATWSVPSPLHPYTYSKVVGNGVDRADVAASDHPDASATKIYHTYVYDDGTGLQWRASDGTGLGALPLHDGDLTTVYDGGTKRVWIWDIAYELVTGYPIIVFAKFESTADHHYWYARWTGAAWDCHEICAAGGYIDQVHPVPPNLPGYYSGGVVLDHSDPARVFCSRYVSGQWEIYRYVTADGGATFTGAAITSGSLVKQIRPVVVRDHAAGLEALWLSGRYTSYVDWDTATMGNIP